MKTVADLLVGLADYFFHNAGGYGGKSAEASVKRWNQLVVNGQVH
jgi:hypothetical protein